VLRPLFLCLMLLVLFGPMGIDIYLPAMPLMQEIFQASANQIQLSLSLFIGSMGLGQLFIGPLADRFGRRCIALAGIVGYFLASIAIANCSSLEQLLCFRMLQGLGASCTAIVTFAVVRDSYSPSDGAKVYSYLNGTLCLVPALAPMLGGMLTLWWGWRSNFHFLALFCFLAFFIILRWLPETRPENTKPVKLFSVGQYLDIIKNRQFITYAVCAMGAMSVVLGYVFYSPQVLMVQLGLSSTEFALVFGANALVLMASSFIAPRCLSKVGRRRSVEIGAALMLFSGVLVPVLFLWGGHSVIGFMLPVVIACCGFSLLLGASASLALEPFAEKAGTATALQGSIQMLGASLVSVLAALLPLALVFSLGVLMAVFGIYALLVRRLQGSESLQLSS
jgi:MFS transporter, DHA1 family, multidrug resistance protein